MNVIEKTRDILKNYSHISEFVNDVHVDFTDSKSKNYGLSSTGEPELLINEDILGNETRQHNFVLYAKTSAREDIDRLANSNFLLELSYWLKTQKNISIDNGVIKEITTANAMMIEIPDNDIKQLAIYSIQIYVKYTKEV